MGLDDLFGILSGAPSMPDEEVERQRSLVELGMQDLARRIGWVPKQINFDPPEFREGMNMTVRRGTYWNANLKKGDAVEIGCETRNEWQPATINYVKVKRFCDMTEADAACHHLGETNYIKLKAAMDKYYENFDPIEIVTLIYFTPIGKS